MAVAGTCRLGFKFKVQGLGLGFGVWGLRLGVYLGFTWGLLGFIIYSLFRVCLELTWGLVTGPRTASDSMVS